jgi:hypothetical protein
MAVNVGASFLIAPVASGEIAAAPTPAPDDAALESTETSTPAEASESSPVGDHALFARVRLAQTVVFEVRDSALANLQCATDLWLSATGDFTHGLTFALRTKAAIENERVNPAVLANVSEQIYRVVDGAKISEETKVLVFDSGAVEGEELPFEVHCGFTTADGQGEIAIAINGKFPMADVLVGFDATGLEGLICDDEEVEMAGVIACLRKEFVNAEERATWVVRGRIVEGYEPPKMIRVKCRMRGAAFGGIAVKPEPAGTFGIEAVVRDLDVQQSVWPFAP